VAIEIPAAARDELARVISGLEPKISGAKWAPPENIHCTLSFLGSVADERVPEISAAIGSAVAGLVDFPTHLEALGAFPSRKRARVVWAGLADSAGGIATVADAVQSALEGVGFKREKRRFTPHLTLARLKIPRAVVLDYDMQPVRFNVDRVTLFESKLGRPHARYSAVATFREVGTGSHRCNSVPPGAYTRPEGPADRKETLWTLNGGPAWTETRPWR
jgi:2'-5' RNA ligase